MPHQEDICQVAGFESESLIEVHRINQNHYLINDVSMTLGKKNNHSGETKHQRATSSSILLNALISLLRNITVRAHHQCFH